MPSPSAVLQLASRTLALALAVGLLLLGGAAPARAADPEPAAASSNPDPDQEPEEEPEEEEDDDDGLRQRLTEREDQRRPLRPWSFPLAGRPLVVSGEYEIDIAYLGRQLEVEADDESARFLLGQELEAEAFYSFGPVFSLYVQARVGADTFDDSTEFFIERGEMWIYTENIAGSGINIDFGRLDFEDERRCWWDEELDALRVEYEAETFSLAVAAAYEFGPVRSDRTFVDPDLEGVLRVIGELSWDWRDNHVFELFALYQGDFSPQERRGQLLSFNREDESDAQLSWVGARWMGIFDLGRPGLLGYWLDTGFVGGEEQLVDFESLPDGRIVAQDITEQDVQGWAFDVGGSWILPYTFAPRLFGGYALGSGGTGPGRDRSYRQTSIHTNETGFGGVERFSGYGVLFDPELSNLGVLTLGVGVSLLRSSSLDLVYHYYRQLEEATFQRNVRWDLELTGADPNLGHEVDLVLAVEEWEHVEFDVVGSVFRTGGAFGEARGRWTYGGFFALRINF